MKKKLIVHQMELMMCRTQPVKKKMMEMILIMMNLQMNSKRNSLYIFFPQFFYFKYIRMTIENAHVEEKAAAIEALGDIVENCM